MSICLQLNGVSKSIGSLQLFSEVSFVIEKYGKTAIIAKNGTGKTTLLNIISGKDSVDKGDVYIDKDIVTGYLEQEPFLNMNHTVFEEVFNSGNSVIKAISKYEKALIENNTKLLDESLALMEHLKAWDHEVKVKNILTQLKIIDLNQRIELLSGGQKKRVALAQILIREPDFLILDEPTNHLDIEMIEWLEEYLKKSNSTLLLVTHDRYFLDRVCNEIVEIENGGSYTYKGNYSWYIDKRNERILAEQAGVEKARNLLRKETDWIRRMPQARATKAKYRIDAYYDLKEKASGRREAGSVNIGIHTSRMGKKIIEVKDLDFSWDKKSIVKDFSYNFIPFEKIGIIGKNGSGKTTFLDLLTGFIAPDSGTVEHGDTIVFGYVRQEGIQFDENKKVIDAAREFAETVKMVDGNTVSVSQFLTHFLFPPSVQYNFISKLSGGEKRRLYLLTVLMKNPNFLILDEPTNDLDIMTLSILEDYLADFPGCVIIVSHDRYFMDKIVDHLFIFDENGNIKDFPGNYLQYREYLENLPKEVKSQPVKEKIIQPKVKASTKLSFKEKQEYELLEKEIDDLETEKSEIEKSLSSGTLGHDELLKKSHRISEIIELVDRKTIRWMELGEKI